jgi:hypothetical protein
MAAKSYFRPVNDDTAQRLNWKIASYLCAGLGLAGAERIADTDAHAGHFWIFHAITDCVITAITYSTDTPGGAAAGDTIKTGDRIYGDIRSLTLASGTGELYKSPVA